MFRFIVVLCFLSAPVVAHTKSAEASIEIVNPNDFSRLNFYFEGSLQKPQIDIKISDKGYDYSETGTLYLKKKFSKAPLVATQEFGKAVFSFNVKLMDGDTIQETLFPLAKRDQEISARIEVLRKTKNFAKSEEISSLRVEQDQLQAKLFKVMDLVAPYSELFGDLLVEISFGDESNFFNEVVATFPRKISPQQLCLVTQRSFFKSPHVVLSKPESMANGGFDADSALNSSRFYLGGLIQKTSSIIERRMILEGFLTVVSQQVQKHQKEGLEIYNMSYSDLNDQFIKALEKHFQFPRQGDVFLNPDYIGSYADNPSSQGCEL